MSFFDMGPLEVLLILLVALIIWGPGKIPEIASMLGKTVRTLRKATFDLTTTVTKELKVEEKDRPSQSRASNDDKIKESSDADTAKSDGAETAGPKD